METDLLSAVASVSPRHIDGEARELFILQLGSVVRSTIGILQSTIRPMEVRFMSVEENKELVRRYFEASGENDLAAWDGLCDPSMSLIVAGFPFPMNGLDAVKQFSAVMHNAIPDDYTLTIEDLIGEGDSVVVRWTVQGTHSAPFQVPGGAIPPTGKKLTSTGISFVTTANGKITEERVTIDLIGLFQQLGLAPAA